MEEAALRCNTPDFIKDDPVQFPRRYSKLEDVEIVALLTACISWGNRKQILRSAERMLHKLGSSPYHYVMHADLEKQWGGNGNVHRTIFEKDILYLLNGLRRVYEKHHNLNSFFLFHNAKDGWDVSQKLNEVMYEANRKLRSDKFIPHCFSKSPRKRINLMLRWMVRRDGIVDIGLWDFMKPDMLYIPLDVHAGATARRLGLLTRKANDWQSVQDLHRKLSQLRPDDPAYYDFALFGLGLEHKKEEEAKRKAAEGGQNLM